MKQLTKAEEQIMHIIWKLQNAFLKDVLEELPDPKPHSNTVATILKILVEKEFVVAKVFGRVHRYEPIVSKKAYSKKTINNLVGSFFDGDYTDAISFMVKEKAISVKDLELLLKQLKK
jgi:BlaI family transcriptional regulator, penicillinase repressor